MARQSVKFIPKKKSLRHARVKRAAEAAKRMARASDEMDVEILSSQQVKRSQRQQKKELIEKAQVIPPISNGQGTTLGGPESHYFVFV